MKSNMAENLKNQDLDRVSPSWFQDGDPKNHILNENNKPITADFINKIFKKYGLNHKVQNLELFQLAMVHVSYLNRSTVTDKTARMLRDVIPIPPHKKHLAMPLKDQNYGRLEFLGDAKIHDILAEYLYERYENEDEGFMTKLRTKIEKSETLSELAKKLNIHFYAVVARNIEQSGGRLNNAPLTEDLFESFIGALSREISFENLKTFVINIIEKELNISEMIYINDNYKEQLMQYFHQLKWGDPKYVEDVDLQRTVKEGCQEVKYFTIYVKNSQGEILGTGKGNSKIRADQNAALDALTNLNVFAKDDDASDYYGEMTDDESVKSVTKFSTKNEIEEDFEEELEEFFEE